MIITRTPLRASIFGGGTDFPKYYRAHGGAVIGFALDRYVWVSARVLPAFFDYRHRVVWSKVETVVAPTDIENPVYREMLKAWDLCAPAIGLEIHYDADLHAKAGLGSSSSFTVGLIHALDKLRGPYAPALAETAIEIEREVLREPGGYQDQIFAAAGGFNRIDFSAGGWRVTPLGNPAELIAHLLLFYTGQQRQASQLEGIKIERMTQNLDHLHAIRRQVDVAERMLAVRDFEGVGRLLDAAWALKRRLAPGVAYPALDATYAAARAAGAWGGKLLGAGGGGFLLLMAAIENHAAIRSALAGLVEVPVGWSPTGSTVVVDQPNGFR